MAGCLCIGGPIKYELVRSEDVRSAVTSQWLFANVVPHIRARFPGDFRLCNVLGKALLFACLSDDERIFVPGELRERVRAAYNALGLEETQPVEKVPLHIYRVRDLLMIDPIGEGDLVSGGGGAGVAGGAALAEAVQTMMVRSSRAEIEGNQRHAATQQQLHEMRNHFDRQFKTLNNNIRGFGGTIEGAFVRQRTQQMPGVGQIRVQTLNDGLHNNLLEDVVRPANLSHLVPSLEMMWKEYKSGLDGNKPAEQFSTKERNVTKKMAVMYGRRNHIWQCIQRLVNAGWSSQVAISRYTMCTAPRPNPTKIINGMIADKTKYKDQGGFHPEFALICWLGIVGLFIM